MDYFTFYIVDDDKAACNMLTEIIEEENLGEVVGCAHDGLNQELTIIRTNPRVVLLDLLMPNIDGITLANNLRSQGFKGGIVMISQVEDKGMVARAYQKGVEFYITKPINRIEVLSVLRQLLFIHTIQQSLEQARMRHQSFAGEPKDKDINYSGASGESVESLRKKLNHVLYQLGLVGEAGVNDIIQIILYLHLKAEPEDVNFGLPLNLQQLYREVISGIKNGREVTDEEVKAFEQRLRRTIKNCFDNICAMGLVDYGDPRFERHAGTLFDFNEVRNRMEELRNETEHSKARINIKKFIQALYAEVTSMPMS